MRLEGHPTPKVVATMYAKMTENRATATIEEAVNFAIDAAQEAYDAAKENDGTEHEATEAARMAYRQCMPLLKTKATVKSFLAAVAKGVSLKFIDADEAKLFLYGAQIWMQVEAGKAEATA